MNSPSYTTTGRFWLVFILTICVICALYGCGGSSDDLETEPEQCTRAPTPQFVGPVLPCAWTV